MSFYLRKSINFGGVRFNFSKSGIGASVGVKGFRVGTNARGNYIHIGRGGLYYRAAIGKKKGSYRAPPLNHLLWPRFRGLSVRKYRKRNCIFRR